MSELELLPKDQKNMTAELIKAVATGLVVGGTLVAPNLPLLLAKRLSPAKSHKMLRSVRYAKSKGWLTFRETKNGQVEVALSAKGRLKWQKIQLSTPLTAKKWNGKWQLVIFDIPIGLRANADAFRSSLKQLGLMKLQRSIWITPFPCQAEVAVLRQIYQVKPYVRLIEAIAIDNEKELKALFKI